MVHPALAFYNFSFGEMVIILVVIMMLFGAKRLPEIGKSLGTGIKEFKKSLTAINEEDEKEASAKIEEKKN